MSLENLEPAPIGMSQRKREVRRIFDQRARDLASWRDKAAFFHSEDRLFLRFLTPPGARVLELGCSTGNLLDALEPAFGVGVDFSEPMIAEAKKAHPNLSFFVGDIEDSALIRTLPGPFDFILIDDTLGSLDDCQQLFENLHPLCTRDTRLVIAYFSHLWYPALKLAGWIGLRPTEPPQNGAGAAHIHAPAGVAAF